MSSGERNSGTPGKPTPYLGRGAYLLPSLFTIGNIFFGFFAIISALNGGFRRAAVLIFIAGILDSLDGRIARLTGTESEFGREYDSLADVLTFGMAPALIAYLSLSQDFGRLGWLVPLFYLVCMATRLARFNVQTRKEDSRYFVGLPAPAAAGSVASVILFGSTSSIATAQLFGLKPSFEILLAGPLLATVLLVGILMVSTFRYPSFKRFDLRRRWSYRVALPIAAALVVIGYDPPLFFLSASALYASWPPIAWVLEKIGLRRRATASESLQTGGKEGR